MFAFEIPSGTAPLLNVELEPTDADEDSVPEVDPEEPEDEVGEFVVPKPEDDKGRVGVTIVLRKVIKC